MMMEKEKTSKSIRRWLSIDNDLSKNKFREPDHNHRDAKDGNALFGVMQDHLHESGRGVAKLHPHRRNSLDKTGNSIQEEG